MSDESLQIAFEIKTACDEISRRLLRWHWEKKPGSHSLDALLQHMAQRQKESPDYYDRLPDLSGKTSWQQLDTTLCMRVLLDPEKEASRPLDLLGDTPHPAAARRACNAIRTARNEAAHASDAREGTQAAILFNEAVESLEEGYAGTAFKTAELEQYYRQAEEYLRRCGAGKNTEPKPERRSSRNAADRENRRTGSTGRSGAQSRSTNRKNGTGSRSTQNRPGSKTRRNPQSARNTGRKNSHRRKRDAGPNRAVVILLLLIALAGLLARAFGMGLLFH